MSEWTDAQEQRLRALIDGAQEDCAGRFAQLERIESENFERVLAAMQAQRVGDRMARKAGEMFGK